MEALPSYSFPVVTFASDVASSGIDAENLAIPPVTNLSAGWRILHDPPKSLLSLPLVRVFAQKMVVDDGGTLEAGGAVLANRRFD